MFFFFFVRKFFLTCVTTVCPPLARYSGEQVRYGIGVTVVWSLLFCGWHFIASGLHKAIEDSKAERQARQKASVAAPAAASPAPSYDQIVIMPEDEQ